jgi:hypothetical protein
MCEPSWQHALVALRQAQLLRADEHRQLFFSARKRNRTAA